MLLIEAMCLFLQFYFTVVESYSKLIDNNLLTLSTFEKKQPL